MTISRRRAKQRRSVVRLLSVLWLILVLLLLCEATLTTARTRRDVRLKRKQMTRGEATFDIQLQFLDKVTHAEKVEFNKAVKRVRSVIKADWGTKVCINKGTVLCGVKFKQTMCVDDVMVFVSLKTIDGNGGVLAQAAPCAVDFDNKIRLGYMVVDRADLKLLMRLKKARDVISHELMHVLGFGTKWDVLKLITPLDGPKPWTYYGVNGNDGFHLLGGSGNIFIADGERADGTDRGHFSESHYGNELMTGILDVFDPRPAPISKMTVGALMDLGFSTENLTTGGEPYTLPASEVSLLANDVQYRLARLSMGNNALSYRGDLLQIPLETVPLHPEPTKERP